MEGEIIEVTRKPRTCPICKNKVIGTILYGMPSFSKKLEIEIESGKTILGGCVIYDISPQWGCTKCNTRFHRTH